MPLSNQIAFPEVSLAHVSPSLTEQDVFWIESPRFFVSSAYSMAWHCEVSPLSQLLEMGFLCQTVDARGGPNIFCLTMHHPPTFCEFHNVCSGIKKHEAIHGHSHSQVVGETCFCFMVFHSDQMNPCVATAPYPCLIVLHNAGVSVQPRSTTFNHIQPHSTTFNPLLACFDDFCIGSFHGVSCPSIEAPAVCYHPPQIRLSHRRPFFHCGCF